MARRLIILLITISFSSSGYSALRGVDTLPFPVVYFGGGFGLNDLGILGVSCEIPIVQRVSATANAGFGMWGGKLGGEVNVYFPTVLCGSFVTVGYMYATGADNIQMTDIEVEPRGTKKNVVLDFLPQQTLSVKYSYALGLGYKKRSKFIFSIGYAAPLKKLPYRIQNSNERLTKDSEAGIKMYEPGGFIFGVRFMFGVGNRY